MSKAMCVCVCMCVVGAQTLYYVECRVSRDQKYFVISDLTSDLYVLTIFCTVLRSDLRKGVGY